MSTETKECPVCGEINDKAAEKCSSCGELFERSTQGTVFDQRGQTVMGKQIYIDGIYGDISHIGDIIVGSDKSDEQAVLVDGGGKPIKDLDEGEKVGR